MSKPSDTLATTRRTALLAGALACLAIPATATTADDAAACAAFSMANWDYEVANFSAEDRSDGWKKQAGGFVLVAERLGHSRATINKIIARDRRSYLKTISAFVLSNDAQSRKIFEARAKICDAILNSAPEMKRYK